MTVAAMTSGMEAMRVGEKGWRRRWGGARGRGPTTRRKGVTGHDRDRRRVPCRLPSLLMNVPRGRARPLGMRRTLSAREDANSITESNTAPPEIEPPETTPTNNFDDQNRDSAQGQEEMTWGHLVPARLRQFWTTSASAQYLRESTCVLWKNLWTLMSLTALNSAARFILVWTMYKTVCVVAVQFFGIPAESIPHEMIPSSSSSGDPNVYQQLADITFLLFKPFDFFLKGIFIAAGLLVCWETSSEPETAMKRPSRLKLIREMWGGLLKSFTSSWESLGRFPHYLRIYIVVGAMTGVYQGLCLLLVPLAFAIKRLMNIQLAVCVSLLQGKKWKAALETSTLLVEPVRKHLYFPYLLLLLMPKGLGWARDFVVRVFPDRLFVDVPEITWGIIATTTVLAFLIDRMAEIFPFVIYSKAVGEKAKDF